VIYAALAAIGALFQALGKLFDWLYARKLVDAGKTAQKLEDLKGQIDAAQSALQARLDIERQQQLNPDRVHDDDGFKRPD
jgi:hypothetical protein